jgi:hypothetical protein
VGNDRRTVLVTLMDIDPSLDDAEFNRWYDEEHVAERMQCPGFISAARFRSVEGSPKYLAVYELAGPEALLTPEYLALPSRARKNLGPHPSELTRRMLEGIRSVARNVYSEIYAAEGEQPDL